MTKEEYENGKILLCAEMHIDNKILLNLLNLVGPDRTVKDTIAYVECEGNKKEMELVSYLYCLDMIHQNLLESLANNIDFESSHTS